jgi:beta-1,4-mannosyl-glycoprotein beta-1,4-N-acetylglucosaminyltransferase
VILDCFLYSGERECLEIRCREYEGLVDRHVAVEGTHTFQGKERTVTPLSELQAISPLLEQAIFTDWTATTPWEREIAQRNSIRDVIRQGDWVLISDADEIVRREVLERLLNESHPVLATAFDLEQFYFRLNLKDESETVLTARFVRSEYLAVPQNMRSLHLRPHERMVPKAGWHFGWLGDGERLSQKLQAFAHEELNTPELTDPAFLERCIQGRYTVHNGHLLTRVPIDDSFPRLVRENPERFKDLIEP